MYFWNFTTHVKSIMGISNSTATYQKIEPYGLVTMMMIRGFYYFDLFFALVGDKRKLLGDVIVGHELPGSSRRGSKTFGK